MFPFFLTSYVKTLAELYDQQHTPESRDLMTVEHEGERISYSYLPPRNAEDLLVQKGIAQKGDMIVVTWGAPMGQVGGTNALRIVKVGEFTRPQ